MKSLKPLRVSKKLSDDDVLDILKKYHEGTSTQASLADKYGISKIYVQALCHGKARRQVFTKFVNSAS